MFAGTSASNKWIRIESRDPLGLEEMPDTSFDVDDGDDDAPSVSSRDVEAEGKPILLRLGGQTLHRELELHPNESSTQSR